MPGRGFRVVTGRPKVGCRGGSGELVLSSAAGPDARATTHARRRDSMVPALVDPSGSRTRPPTI